MAVLKEKKKKISNLSQNLFQSLWIKRFTCSVIIELVQGVGVERCIARQNVIKQRMDCNLS